MQQGQLSPHSLNVLFTLKQVLIKYKKELNVYLFKCFGENKTHLNDSEFETIFRYGDKTISFTDIKQLFDELQTNALVDVKKLNEKLMNLKNTNLMLAAFESDLEINNQIKYQLKEVQLNMLKQDPYYIFDLYDTNKDEKLELQQMSNLLVACSSQLAKNLDLRKNTIKWLFRRCQNRAISRQIFFEVFGMQNIPLRIKFDKPPHVQEVQTDDQITKICLLSSKIYNSQINKQQLQSALSSSIHSVNIHENFEAYKYFRLKHDYKKYPQMIKLMEFFINNNQVFVDPEGPTNSNKKYTEKRAEAIFRNRPFYLFQMAVSVLDRQQSRIGIGQLIEPKDIIQGSIGDCYFLSSISSIVWRYPQHIVQLFLFEVNPVGFYVVRLFNDGQWGNIVLDDNFFCDAYGSPAFARPHTNEIWVMLLEKAWAKINISYQNIDLGSSLQGLIALTGAPSKYYRKQDQQVMDKIKQAWQKKWIATCSGSQLLNQMKKQQTSKLGLIGKHAYSVHKLIEVVDPDTKQKLTLIRMRNPWGDLQWKGDWSFKSNKWSPQLRQKYNYKKNPQDGSFYMPWKQFQKYFGSVSVCAMIQGNVNSSLRINILRHKSTFIQMHVTTAGHYTISLYQQSKRKYKHSQNYKLSEARLILMKQIPRQNKLSYLQYITSGNKATSNIHLSTYLEVGTYFISAKIAWRLFEQHQAVVTSYGPAQVSFKLFTDQTISRLFKEHLINSYHQKIRGNKIHYSNIKLDQAYREVSINLQHGIGYIFFCNPTNTPFSSVINFKNAKGIKLIKPFYFPLDEVVDGYSERLFGLFISGQGYSYVMEQKVKQIKK